MKVDIGLLIKHVQDKMYSEMTEKRQTLGLRYFAPKIGISTPTLSRFLSNKDKGIKLITFLALVNWAGNCVDDYLIMEFQKK